MIRSSDSHRLPQRANRDGIQTVSKRGAGLAIVEQNTRSELRSGSLPELSQSSEVGRRDTRGGFDLDARDVPSPAFEHDVHLRTVLVSEVEKRDLLLLPAGLTTQFLEHERLEELAKQRAVSRQRHGVVEGELRVVAALADLPGEGRLAALARTVDQHDWRVGERFDQSRRDVPRAESGLVHIGQS